MQPSQTLASELLALSKDRSQQGRNKLFRHVADLLLNPKFSATGADQHSLLDILTMLQPKVDVRVRRELAGALYSMTTPPVPLIRLLMNDVAEVAGPLLRHVPLTADAIRALTPGAGPAARQLLMARPDLPADLRALWAPTPPGKEAASSAFPLPDQQATPPRPPGEAPSASKADALRRGRARFQDTVRAATDWQWETDRNGVLTFVSDGAAKAFDRPAAYMVGAPLMDLVAAVSGKPQQPDALDRALSRLRPFDDLVVMALAPALKPQHWRLAGVPVFDRETGRFLGFRGTAQAIPPAVPRQFPRQPGQQPTAPVPSGLDPAVISALQTLSHEIRTPLNAILGFSEIVALGTRGPLNDRYRGSAREAVTAGWQLNKVIADILECAPLLSGTQPLDIKMLSLVQTVRAGMAAVAGEASEKSITLAIAPDSVSPVIHSDSTALIQCLVNLLRRAVLESSSGSRMEVAIRTEQNGTVEILIPVQRGGSSSEKSPLSTLYQAFAEELARRLHATVSTHPASGHTRELRLRLPLTEVVGSTT